MAELWQLAGSRVAQFAGAALAYDQFRPRYPEAVFETILTHVSNTGQARDVVEVGAGTGIATIPLVERNVRVTAIEPAPAMAAIAKAKLNSRAELFVGRFEDWPGRAPLDLVVAFNSWHWVDPTVSVAKAAQLLRPGGCLALVWTDVLQHGQPPFEQRLAEHGMPFWSVFDTVTACREHVESDPRFSEPTILRCNFERKLDADTFLAVRNTYGGSHNPDADDQIRSLINDEFGGAVTKVEAAVVHLYSRQ
jgi:SAM-dependent methyltransferase